VQRDHGWAEPAVHLGAAPWTPREDPVLLERLERRPDRRAAHPQHVGKLVLRREAAVLEAALEDRMQDGFTRSMGKRRATHRLHDLLAPDHPLADVGDLYY
jgi:hypothetical protein